jgi:hypothetical protein
MIDFRNLNLRRNGLIERVRMECSEYRVAFQVSVYAGLRLANATGKGEERRAALKRDHQDAVQEFGRRTGSIERLRDEARELGVFGLATAFLDDAQDRNCAWLRSRRIDGGSVNQMMKGV